MKTAIVATLVVALSSGCVYEHERAADWHGDARFTENERAEIQRGADWIYAQGGWPAPVIAWDLEPVVGILEPNTIRRERGAYGKSGATGLCEPSAGGHGALFLDVDGNVPTNEPPVGAHLAGLTAHEMAHCVLGFVDNYRADEPKSEGIMRVLTPMRWTDAEEAQCSEHPKNCLRPR